jgi:hypothetical protein
MLTDALPIELIPMAGEQIEAGIVTGASVLDSWLSDGGNPTASTGEGDDMFGLTSSGPAISSQSGLPESLSLVGV